MGDRETATPSPVVYGLQWLKERGVLGIHIHMLLILAVFLVTRGLFLFTPAGRFGDADQAVFGMMAQQIAALKEFPIFCWEAHYAGAPVAYVSAVLFHFFGSSFVQLRIAMMLIVFPAFVFSYFVYRQLFGNHRALIAVLFLLFCPYFVLNLTTGAYGGYGESFLGTALIILLSWKIQKQIVGIPMPGIYFLLGLICGFFSYIQFYVIPVIFVFVLPTLFRLVRGRMKASLLFSLGGFIGFSPLIIYNLTFSGGTLYRAFGWMFLIGREEISLSPLEVIGKILAQKASYLRDWFSNIPLIFGKYVLPDLSGEELQIVAGCILIAVLTAYIVFSLRRSGRQEPVVYCHRQFAIYLLVFALFHWTASLHADRHFMPIFFVIPIAFFSLTEGCARFKKTPIVILLMLGVLQVVGWDTEFRATRFDPNPVAKTMEKEGIREFYASYWTGYPIMFLGEGRLIGSPMLLPFQEPFSDRRPIYTEQVRRARDAVFVFGGAEKSLKKEFLSFLQKNDIGHDTIEIDGTAIYYRLSKQVVVSWDKKDRRNIFSFNHI
jgi:4-amino-4-deoxy-L-arabinose transferase-like glycosyltransferase